MKKNGDAEIVEKFSGAELVGKKYAPVFSYFAEKNFFRVVAADFVSDDDGTGIVHLAPFGEDDFNFAQQKNWEISDFIAVDENGNFSGKIADFAGESILDPATNKKICEKLKIEKKLFLSEQHSHNYPHCYRCETPLFYAPQRAYFLNVQKIKKKMIAENEKINWTPSHLKNGRFKKGLETAPDWNLSRSRFWGSPIPIWKCEICGDEKVVESIAEIEKFSGQKIRDLHKHFLDKIFFPCEKCGEIEIFFVRHGQAEHNLEKKICGTSDTNLTKKGEMQILETAEILQNEKFDALLFSPQKRAKKSAEIIFKKLKKKPQKFFADKNLRERDFGEIENQPEKNFSSLGTFDFVISTPPGGESFAEICSRAKKILRPEFGGKKILLVSHAGVGHALRNLCGEFSAEKFQKIKNATILKLKFSPKMRRTPEVLDCWFESGAMPIAQNHFPFSEK